MTSLNDADEVYYRVGLVDGAVSERTRIIARLRARAATLSASKSNWHAAVLLDFADELEKETDEAKFRRT